MKLVLDTHAALWWVDDDRRLGSAATGHLADPANAVYVSAIVAWEVAIKRSLGKLDAPSTLIEVLLGAGCRALPVTLQHAAAVEHLPAHHREPFDRLLVAQAIVERAVLVSADPAFDPYDVAVIW